VNFSVLFLAKEVLNNFIIETSFALRTVVTSFTKATGI
jgi:hypothetical protein